MGGVYRVQAEKDIYFAKQRVKVYKQYVSTKEMTLKMLKLRAEARSGKTGATVVDLCGGVMLQGLAVDVHLISFSL